MPLYPPSPSDAPASSGGGTSGPDVEANVIATRFDALTNGLGWSIGDRLVRYYVVDLPGGTVLSTKWFNETTNLASIAPVVGVDVAEITAAGTVDVDAAVIATRFDALTAGAGWSIGDKVVRYYVVDLPSGAVLSTKWFNETAAAAIVATPVIGTDVAEPIVTAPVDIEAGVIATRFDALTAGAGWSIGDKVVRYYVVDLPSGAVLSTKWYNETAAAAIVATPVIGVDVAEPTTPTVLGPLTTVDQTSTTVGTTSDVVLPPNPLRRYLMVINQSATQDVWVQLDGATATAAAPGLKLAAGQHYESYVDATSLTSITAIASAAGAVVVVLEGY